MFYSLANKYSVKTRIILLIYFHSGANRYGVKSRIILKYIFCPFTNKYNVKTRVILLIYRLFSGQQIHYKDQEPGVAASRSCRGPSLDVSQLTAMLRSVWTSKINYPSTHRATVCIILSSLTRQCVDELNVCGRSQLWNAVCSLS